MGRPTYLCHQQQQQIKRDVNKARSVYNISSQSSLYTPIIDPPRRLPSAFNVDLGSKWQTSALIASALESVTLPSRLRPYHDFEASLAGDAGTHRIFELQSTIIQDEPDAERRLDGTQGTETESSKVQTKFDVDFSYDGLECKDPHIFNQVQVARGNQATQVGRSRAEDMGIVRKQRSYNLEPMLQRLVVSTFATVPCFCADETPASGHHCNSRF